MRSTSSKPPQTSNQFPLEKIKSRPKYFLVPEAVSLLNIFVTKGKKRLWTKFLSD